MNKVNRRFAANNPNYAAIHDAHLILGGMLESVEDIEAELAEADASLDAIAEFKRSVADLRKQVIGTGAMAQTLIQNRQWLSAPQRMAKSDLSYEHYMGVMRDADEMGVEDLYTPDTKAQWEKRTDKDKKKYLKEIADMIDDYAAEND
jgi:anion-transporting  ArsA/GET3 family ATPase